MKERNLYALTAVFCLLLIVISIYLILTLPYGKESIQIRYSVGDRAGFNLNSSALNYGILLPGSSETRSVQIVNNNKFPIYVEFRADKNTDSLLRFNRSRQAVEPGEKGTFPVSLFVPVDAAAGNYTGTFSALIFR